MRKRTPESLVQSAVMDYLQAKHILAFRMQTGAMKLDNRFVRFGVPGMADILAFPKQVMGWATFCRPTWIETKAPKGRQSELQKSFQKMVEEEGHSYILAYSVDDLEKM